MSDTFDFARRVLSFEEGCLSQPYDCGTGKKLKAQSGFVTIGIGRNLDANPLTEDEIDFIFDRDFRRAYAEGEKIFGVNGFFKLSIYRRVAIISLIFHLGAQGFRGFKKMIDAIKRENWDEAIAQMWDSDMGREPRFIARLRRTEKLLRDEKVIEYGTN